MPSPPARATWLHSDRPLARAVARPITRFLHVEASGGVLLAVAVVVALVWANSPWSTSYVDFWHTELSIRVGGWSITEDLQHWVNDGLMTLFFFVIGLEIKHELSRGQLTTIRRAAIPAAGALGGMIVPAALYAAFNIGGAGGAGWGIPMATDVAFALGVLALLGSRVPSELKVLLLGLAIVDDIGAIVVIALFYADGIHGQWLVAAAVGLGLVVVLQRMHVRYVPLYAAVGIGIWFATFESGVHATIAGVVLGLLTPARPFLDRERVDDLPPDAHVTPAEVRSMGFRLRESVPTTERLQDFLHPWTSYVVIPVFALANAGVVLSADTLADAVTSPVSIGVIVGLVAGKLFGVAGAVLLAARLGVGTLPAGITARHIFGMAGIAGIGFTVSIFVAGLAFDDPAITDEAKIGVLAASAIAALVGAAILLTAPRGGSGAQSTVRSAAMSSGPGSSEDSVWSVQ